MISRRNFLKGVGAAAAAGAAFPSVLAGEEKAPPASSGVGPGPVPVVLLVDGAKRKLRIEPRVTLLAALREHMGDSALTGPKEACDRGACGACTVLREGKPICACTTLAIENQGMEITTIAGLGTPENPHPLQTAFVKHDALQCGFCTPGMVTSLAGLLSARPGASEEEIKKAVSGNLCRCGTYPKVFEAALEVVKLGEGEVAVAERKKLELGFTKDKRTIEIQVPDGEPVPWDLSTTHTVVGTDVPRLDGVVKATGTAEYTSDVRLPGMLHARVLRSPHPRAKILSIDTTGAAGAPGVKAVWTTDRKEALFAGQEIAAVAAATDDAAEDALERIRVEWKALPHCVDVEEAMAAGAPRVLPSGENVREDRAVGRGDLEKGYAAAAKTVEARYRTAVQTHACLETHGVVCRWKGDELTVWASTQGTFSVRNELSRHFRVPAGKIVVLTEHMGGGFGSKFGARIEGVICAELAKMAGAPVRLMVDRHGEHVATGNRPDSIQDLKVGVAADGAVTALEATSWGTGGIRLGAAGCRNDVIYEFPNLGKKTFHVATNGGPAAAMRAPGWPQGVFALESALDEAAFALGMDPLALRERNDPDPVRREQRRIGMERIGWGAKKNSGKPSKGPFARGVGYAATTWYNFGRPPAEVFCEISADGSVWVLNGAQDIGTGTRTLLAVVVAEELGIPVGAIGVRLGDTRLPYGPASGGSSTAPALAPAARSAAFAAKRELLKAVASRVGVEPDDLDLGEGGVIGKDGALRFTWKDACAAIDGEKVTGVGRRQANHEAYRSALAGCQFAEVEVDVETGVVEVVKVVAIQDCGQPIDRLTLVSQINGGVIQGMAFALNEERIMDRRTGRMLNANLESYKIPGSLDMPEIDVVTFPVAIGANNAGVAGVGEPPVIPTAAAIANAVFDATGARCRELPMTPMRVLDALARRKEGR